MQFFETIADAFSNLTLSNYLILFTTIFLVVLVILYASFEIWFKHLKLLERAGTCGGLVFLLLVAIPVLAKFNVALPTWLEKLVPGNLTVNLIAAIVCVITAVVKCVWHYRHLKTLVRYLEKLRKDDPKGFKYGWALSELKKQLRMD